MTKKFFSFIPRFFIRQLYRFQFGYSKIAGLLSMGNFVSLLLLLLDQIQLFNIQWWHILLFYVGIFFFSIFFVLLFERLNAWQAERYLTFKISQSEIVKLQHLNLALSIAEVSQMTVEERNNLRARLNYELFQEKNTTLKKMKNDNLTEDNN